MAGSGNILNLPFHTTVPLNPSLSTTLHNWITQRHAHQHPDLFLQDLKTLDSLRAAAIAAGSSASSPSPAGIIPLQKYIAQLTWLAGNRVPLDIGAEFTWYTSLSETEAVHTVDNLRFELANVEYNLGALYCQLGVATNRGTGDGLKVAANYFCLAAGVLGYLSTSVVPQMRTSALPEDMEPLALNCVQQLLLAQAQECVWAKAVKDGSFKDGTIAKLAAKVSDYYAAAADAGRQSGAISATWLHHLRAKQRHFAAAAQFRAACDCLDKGRYGEEVARLSEALQITSTALRDAGRRTDKSVIADLQGLKSRVEGDLQRARKDNDVIYLQVVPSSAELKPLGRAEMVAPRCPVEVAEPLSVFGGQKKSENDLGKPLFANLVPHSVHLAAAVYENRRESRIDGLVGDLEALTARIHALLQSLHLPGSLQVLEKPLGLPPGLVAHANEIRQQNGLERLQRAIKAIDKLKETDRHTFQEGVTMLQTEASEDAAARAKYGTDRWSRPESAEAAAKLYTKVEEIQGYFAAADGSDKTVRERGRDNEDKIRLLCGTDRELERYVPSSRTPAMAASPEVQRQVQKLRGVMNELTRFEARRKRKVEALQTKAAADDVNAELLAESERLQRAAPMEAMEAAQFEELFDARLARRYDAELKTLLAEETAEQHTLLSALAEANTSFVTATQRSDSAGTDERQAKLQELENAYFSYKEIIQNLDVGRKFYNDLGGIAAKFRDDARAFVYSRRADAVALEGDVLNGDALVRGARQGLKSLSLNNQQQQQQNVRNDQEVQLQPRPAAVETIEAPQPVKPVSLDLQAEQQYQHQYQHQQQPQQQGNGSQSQSQSQAQSSAADPAPPATARMPEGTAGSSSSGSATWNPGMGIKFAGLTTPVVAPGLSPAGTGAGAGDGDGAEVGSAVVGYPNRDKRWDPSRGMRFMK